MRRHLPETLTEKSEAQDGNAAPLPVLYGLFGLMMLSGATVATYTLSYLTSFGSFVLGLTPRMAFGLNQSAPIARKSRCCGSSM